MRELRPRARGTGTSRGKTADPGITGAGGTHGGHGWSGDPQSSSGPRWAPPAPGARRTGGVPGGAELSRSPRRSRPCAGRPRAPHSPHRFSRPARRARCHGNPDVTRAHFAAEREGSARHSVALCGSTGVRSHGGGGPGSGGGRERQRERGGGERGRKERDGLSGRPPPLSAGLRALSWPGWAQRRTAWPGWGCRVRDSAGRCRGGTGEHMGAGAGPSPWPRSARPGL